MSGRDTVTRSPLTKEVECRCHPGKRGTGCGRRRRTQHRC